MSDRLTLLVTYTHDGKARLYQAVIDELEQHSRNSFENLIDVIKLSLMTNGSYFLGEVGQAELKKAFDRLRAGDELQWARLLYGVPSFYIRYAKEFKAMSPFADRDVKFFMVGDDFHRQLTADIPGDMLDLLSIRDAIFMAEWERSVIHEFRMTVSVVGSHLVAA